jgi:hypothetical protein
MVSGLADVMIHKYRFARLCESGPRKTSRGDNIDAAPWKMRPTLWDVRWTCVRKPELCVLHPGMCVRPPGNVPCRLKTSEDLLQTIQDKVTYAEKLGEEHRKHKAEVEARKEEATKGLKVCGLACFSS